MTSPVDISHLVKSSDVVLSLFKKASDHAPFLIAIFFTSAAASFTPTSYFPVYFREFLWAFPFLSLFLGAYILLLSYYGKKRFYDAREHLKHLGKDEKHLLQQYLIKDISCMMLSPILSGPASTLISKDILTITSSMFDALKAPVAIQPFFQTYLRDHPELLGLSKDDIGKEPHEDESEFDADGF